LDKNAENSPAKMVLFYFGEKAPTKQPQTFPQCFVGETFPSYIKKWVDWVWFEGSPRWTSWKQSFFSDNSHRDTETIRVNLSVNFDFWQRSLRIRGAEKSG